MRLLFTFWFLVSISLFGEILSSNRVIAWDAGVVGGIPYYTNSVNVMDYGAVGDGVTDDYAAITNAIGHATRGSAVYFPAGTYYLSTEISSANNNSVVLRGAGIAQTKLISYAGVGTSGSITFRGSGSSSNSVFSGYRGQSNLLMNSVAGLSVGKMVTLRQKNDTNIVIGLLSDPNGNWQGQNVIITSISGTNVGISRPLYWDYTNSLLEPYISQRTAITNCGLENFTLECLGTNSRSVFFYIANNCWASNVVVTNSGGRGFAIEVSAKCTIKYCAAINHRDTGQERYGIQVSSWSSDNLVEDNILDGNGAGIIMQGGAAGNIAGYNYVYRAWSATPVSTLLKSGLALHGDFPNYNLYEGNNVTRVFMDNYWGCNTANTIARNWVRRQGLNENGSEQIYDIVAIRNDATNYYNNFIGNILCSPRDIGDSNPAHLVWEIGEDYGRGASTGNDTNVWLTTIRHGNFDYVSQTTNWDGAIADHSIPNSYYLTSKPAWFGRLAWPPYGPDVNVTTSITNSYAIPAQARYWGQNYDNAIYLPFRKP